MADRGSEEQKEERRKRKEDFLKKQKKGAEYKKRWKAALKAGDAEAAKELMRDMKGQDNLVAPIKPFRGGVTIKRR